MRQKLKNILQKKGSQGNTLQKWLNDIDPSKNMAARWRGQFPLCTSSLKPEVRIELQ